MTESKGPDRHADSAPEWASGPTDVPAAGSDPDSHLRELKTRLARAESSGDGNAEAIRDQIAELRNRPSTQRAAGARREAAQGDPGARTRAPQGRTPASPAKTPTGGSSGGRTPASGGNAGGAGTTKQDGAK